MADFSSLSVADQQAIANKDWASISTDGVAFLEKNFPATPQAAPQATPQAPESQSSAAERFAYQFQKSDTDVSNAATYLESRFPLGDRKSVV